MDLLFKCQSDLHNMLTETLTKAHTLKSFHHFPPSYYKKYIYFSDHRRKNIAVLKLNSMSIELRSERGFFFFFFWLKKLYYFSLSKATCQKKKIRKWLNACREHSS